VVSEPQAEQEVEVQLEGGTLSPGKILATPIVLVMSSTVGVFLAIKFSES